jgi:hypothetical protein
METEPTYTLWTPRRVGRHAVRFNATPASRLEWPEAGADFYGHLLRDLGVDGEVTGWEVLPYRTRYHGRPDAEDWRDRWKLNWRVTVELASAPARDGFDDVYETDGISYGKPMVVEDVHALLIADFPDRERADAARSTLVDLADAEPAFESFEVAGEFHQLQIDLGPRPQAYFSAGGNEVEEIQRACRDAGGWPTFEERLVALTDRDRRTADQ